MPQGKKMLKKIILILRRLTRSNYFYVARHNKVHFSCNAKNTKMYVAGKDNLVQVDDSVETYDLRIAIMGNNNRLVIHQNCFLSGAIELIGDGNHIEIGANSKCGSANIFAHYGTSIAIGEGCLFSDDIQIRTTDSHSILDATGKRINPDKNIVLEDRVWLGRGVTVLKGSHIESDVVVGTMSVVSKTIPKNTLVAGTPARVLRENITWSGDAL